MSNAIIELSIDDGENYYTVQQLIPEAILVSSGPLAMRSALIGTVDEMLDELCGAVWLACGSGSGDGPGGG